MTTISERPGPGTSTRHFPLHEHSLNTFLGRLQRDHPDYLALVDRARVDRATRHGDGAHLSRGAREFSNEDEGGRGGSYRDAQRLTFARARGAQALLGLLAEGRS